MSARPSDDQQVHDVIIYNPPLPPLHQSGAAVEDGSPLHHAACRPIEGNMTHADSHHHKVPFMSGSFFSLYILEAHGCGVAASQSEEPRISSAQQFSATAALKDGKRAPRHLGSNYSVPPSPLRRVHLPLSFPPNASKPFFYRATCFQMFSVNSPPFCLPAAWPCFIYPPRACKCKAAGAKCGTSAKSF